MEKLVYEYLNSMVGDNPTLRITKYSTHFERAFKMFSYAYIVNGVKVEAGQWWMMRSGAITYIVGVNPFDEDEPINDPQEVLPEENPSPANSRQSLYEVKKHGK